MEVQQMKERLLSKMGANQAELKTIQQTMDANQAKAEANLKEIKEDVKTYPNHIIISQDHKT